jgi:hypothetical protein
MILSIAFIAWVVGYSTYCFFQIWKLTRPRLTKHNILSEAEFIKDHPNLYLKINNWEESE